jgi:anti-sigma factor RsiW
MDCKTARDMLPSYFDDELDRATGRELETHLDSCAECRAALIQLDLLRRTLRDNAPHYAAPSSLRERMRAESRSTNNSDAEQANATDGSSTRGARRRPPAWWHIAAACVLAFTAGSVSVHLWNSGQTTESANAQLARDLFSSHWRALAATSPVDVISSDRHTVKPWFAGRVAAAPVVRDFAEQGFALAGGRIDYVGTARVPVLVYRHGQHLIDVFVLPQDAAAVTATARLGYALDPVMLDTQPAAVVSDMDPQELSRFTNLLAAHDTGATGVSR